MAQRDGQKKAAFVWQQFISKSSVWETLRKIDSGIIEQLYLDGELVSTAVLSCCKCADTDGNNEKDNSCKDDDCSGSSSGVPPVGVDLLSFALVFPDAPARSIRRWLPDECRSECPCCSSLFGILTRKHHCRLCGDVFCDDCSAGREFVRDTSSSAPTPGEVMVRPERVCKECQALVTRVRCPTEGCSWNGQQRALRDHLMKEESTRRTREALKERMERAANLCLQIRAARTADRNDVRGVTVTGKILEDIIACVPFPFTIAFKAAQRLCDLSTKTEANKAECVRLAERVLRIESAIVQLHARSPSPETAHTVEALAHIVDDAVLLLSKFQPQNSNDEPSFAVGHGTTYIEKLKGKVRSFCAASDFASEFDGIHRRLSEAIMDLQLVHLLDPRDCSGPDLQEIRAAIHAELQHVLDELKKHQYDFATKVADDIVGRVVKLLDAFSVTSSTRIPVGVIRSDDVEVERSRPLGVGAFGSVYPGTLFATTPVAVKEYSNFPNALRQFSKELRILSGIRHKNVVRVYGVVSGDLATPAIVLERMVFSLNELIHQKDSLSSQFPFPTLVQHQGAPPSKLTQEQKWFITKEIICGLARLHGGAVDDGRNADRIVHGDVKPQNVMLSYNFDSVKLIDFGMAKLRVSIEQMTASGSAGGGTIAYMAPELMLGEGSQNETPTDVFSFGVLLYELWTEVQPWGDTPQNVVRIAVMNGERPDSHGGPPLHALPPVVQSVISACWRQVPLARPTFSELMELHAVALDSLADEWPQFLRPAVDLDHEKSLKRSPAITIDSVPEESMTTPELLQCLGVHGLGSDVLQHFRRVQCNGSLFFNDDFMNEEFVCNAQFKLWQVKRIQRLHTRSLERRRRAALLTEESSARLGICHALRCEIDGLRALQQHKEMEEAEEWILRGAALGPTDFLDAEGCGRLGSVRRFSKAQCFVEALRRNPSCSRAWIELGTALHGGERISVSSSNSSVTNCDCFVEALVIDPVSAAGWCLLGRTLPSDSHIVVAGRRYTKFECLQEALCCDEANAEAWCSLGLMLTPSSSESTNASEVLVDILGRKVSRRMCFIAALERNSRMSTAWQALGRTLAAGETVQISSRSFTGEACLREATDTYVL